MFTGVRSEVRLLLASVSIAVLGILLPWSGIHEAPIKGFQLQYGINILILSIASLIVVHMRRKLLAAILIVILSVVSIGIVVQAYIGLSSSAQELSFYSLRIGLLITGLGVLGMILSGATGISNYRSKRK